MKNVKMGRVQLVLLLMAIAFALICGVYLVDTGETKSVEDLYTEAVADAEVAEEGEIKALVNLTPTDEMTTWDDQERVLLLSWHKYPESYPEGEMVDLKWGAVWTFTDQEIAHWYQAQQGVTDWDLRLEQVIGLPPGSQYTHMTGFWVTPDDVLRPAYETDITKPMRIAFPSVVDPAYKEWFDNNANYSYVESAYPWTRLGYTYDWADNGVAYGLSEFLIKEGSVVQVAFTKDNETFLQWLDQGASMASNDAPALSQ